MPGIRGGAFNLRIVSASVPDWSSRENFVRSALSGWKSNHEKALAQFRWSYLGRRVGNCVLEDERPVLDPILFFNSYGITYCSMISAINCALWEAWGCPSRCVNLPGHVVAEVFYDGAWHMFDNDFYNYFLNEKGQVASAAELEGSRIHGNVQELKPGEYYIFDHCPTASAPRGRIYMGPSSWSIIEVARDWYPPGKVKPRLDFTGAHAGHRYIMGIRPRESYTRYWRPLGTGDLYARPLNNGKGDPMDQGSVLKNSRSNGEWVWEPDLSRKESLFAAQNLSFMKEGLCPANPAEPAAAVFRVLAANVITSARVTIQYEGELALAVSGNGGHSWESVALSNDTPGSATAIIANAVSGRLEYLLRFELPRNAVLKRMTVRTITQVNPRTLPGLRLGRNEIAVVSDEHLEYLIFNPRLTGDSYLHEVHAARGWQSLPKPRDWEPSLRGVERCELVLKATAPRDIRHVRMACTAHLTEPAAELELAMYDGKTWQTLGKYEFDGAPYDRRISAETREIPAGTREVLLRYAYDMGGSGLVNVFAEVGYAPAGEFMPIDVTYCWSEWRDGQWVERRHVERVSSPYHRYVINVGGLRPPRMNWLRIEPAGDGATGYSDGQDVVPAAGRQTWSVFYGRNLSTGCPYEVNRPPHPAFPDKEGKLLTDGFIGVASYWALSGIDLRDPQKRNQKRVGELVVWAPGDEVVITVDLGQVHTMGGAKICAIQPNEEILFPEVMIVEVSADGLSFVRAGEAHWEECFFPPVEQEHWEGFDSPLYDHLPAGGIIDYRFPVVFEKPLQGRYIRFRLKPSQVKGRPAGIGLWGVEVFDRVERRAWDDRLQLPKPPH
ncbi:MAG: hypothetical protein ACUVWX_05930 [Kiritimatiellia bacterium]